MKVDDEDEEEDDDDEEEDDDDEKIKKLCPAAATSAREDPLKPGYPKAQTLRHQTPIPQPLTPETLNPTLTIPVMNLTSWGACARADRLVWPRTLQPS